MYVDIGPSSFKKRTKHVVTLSPDDVDDRVEYALLNHNVQKSVVEASSHYPNAGKLNFTGP